MRDGKIYYTNSHDFISENDLQAAINERISEKREAEGKSPLKKPIKITDEHRKEYMGWVLNRNNETPGLISLWDFKKQYSS